MRKGIDCAIVLIAIAGAIAVDSAGQKPGWTYYPPSIHMQTFLGCSSGDLCTRTENFQVGPLANDCCAFTLTVTNGDGHGTDEVRSYEVFLNGIEVIPKDHSRQAKATVKLRRSNSLKVILNGEPFSRVFVLVAYDTRQSK